MEHLTQDGRRDMVQYGRLPKEEGALLSVLTATLLWDALLTIPEGEEP